VYTVLFREEPWNVIIDLASGHKVRNSVYEKSMKTLCKDATRVNVIAFVEQSGDRTKIS